MKSLGGKTEIELWLDKISKIPKADYIFIGSGGYAKVYKIKIQTELFAIKVVRGVGNFSDYQTQVRALEKEYGMVTSLDKHPRIIIFFGLVKGIKEIQLIIIMEYLEKGSLADILKDKKPLPGYSDRWYLLQILEGVDFLQKKHTTVIDGPWGAWGVRPPPKKKFLTAVLGGGGPGPQNFYQIYNNLEVYLKKIKKN